MSCFDYDYLGSDPISIHIRVILFSVFSFSCLNSLFADVNMSVRI